MDVQFSHRLINPFLFHQQNYWNLQVAFYERAHVVKTTIPENNKFFLSHNFF